MAVNSQVALPEVTSVCIHKQTTIIGLRCISIRCVLCRIWEKNIYVFLFHFGFDDIYLLNIKSVEQLDEKKNPNFLLYDKITQIILTQTWSNVLEFLFFF